MPYTNSVRTLAALVLAAAGCGRVGFADRSADARVPTGEAAPDASLLAQPFTNVTEVAVINGAGTSEDDPTLTGDLLEIFFDSDRPGGMGNGDIWTAKRATAADPFGTPTLVAELASPADDTTPEVSLDGLTMYFASDRTVTGNRDIYMTTRPDRASAWSMPVRVAELSTSALDDSAEPLPDGLHLVMSTQAYSPTVDLELATRASTTDPWGAPVLLPGLSDPSLDESQQCSNPETTVIYFVCNRAPSVGDAIFVGTRPDASSSFTVTYVPELDSSATDADPWLSPDLHTIYFSSKRKGTYDIFMATR
jgi:Tol biopolymer transport system component